MDRIVVCGIGTDVGKTRVSAILIEALGADYWKPVQCGNLEMSDTDTVRSLVKRTDTVFHPEQFRFKEPAAPLQASRSEGIFLSLDMIELPKQSSRPLIVELSGGLMVPINEKQLLCEAFFKKGFEWVIVSQNYLGSINHTLLSVDFLRQSGEPIKGIFFNGDALPGAEEFILNYTQLPCLGRLRNAH